jgi:alpha-glucosidase (family GH31 glycosyl hydrolase)
VADWVKPNGRATAVTLRGAALREDIVQEIAAARGVVPIAEAPIPIDVSVAMPGILRIRLGRREFCSPTSYLGWRQEPEAGNADRDAGDIVARFATDPARIVFADRAGRVLISLMTSDAQLEPAVRLRFEITGEQHFFGLGEGGQQFDRLGATRRLWNYQANRGQGSDMAVPLLVSQAGYALFIDHAADGTIAGLDGGDGSWIEYCSAPGPLDLYVLGGTDLRSVMGRVADLLGHATLPPRWALGYLQSSRHFDSTDELRALATEFRARKLPCDGLIFLSTYGSAKGWNRGVGHLEFEPKLFADPAALIGEFRRAHFHVISHEYPVLHAASPLHDEAVRRGYLLDAGYPLRPPGRPLATNFKEGQRYLDFSQDEVRRWWWQQHLDLVALGIEGWWLDGGEGPPADTALAAGSATQLHNRYDLMRQQAFAEGEAADRPDRRPWLLCRSGGPGMQRYGAVPWSGDINTTFATLESQIRIGLNCGMSGTPHWGTDIGGFYQVAPDGGELFARWFQFGAFCPIFRGHGFVWRDHLPWAHGDTIEAICRRYLELRYRLMPYTYTLAWQAHRDGLPLMRPLVLNYPQDPRAWDLGSEFLWGDDLLVAPVTRAGATHWPVYLPEGTWYDFWTHEAHAGPAGITVEAPLDRLPLFVRAGAIIPLGPPLQYDGERPCDAVTLLVYPDRSSRFTLYEDDGLSNAYQHGGAVRTGFACDADAAGITLTIGSPEGDASLISPGRSYLLQIHVLRRPRVVEAQGQALPESAADGPGWWLDGHFLFVRVPLTPASLHIGW